MLNFYNTIGCWILTLLLVLAKVFFSYDISWPLALSPVVSINCWFAVLSIYSRVVRVMSAP